MMNAPLYIVLDNDECIGSWRDLSMLFSYYIKVLKKAPEPELFVTIIEHTNVIRPNIRHLFDKLYQLREDGLISGIIMFTAASDREGWVTFLRRILEVWYNAEAERPLYDFLFCYEDIKKWCDQTERVVFTEVDGTTGGVNKYMDILKSQVDQNARIIMVDDRTEFVHGADHLLKVCPYTVAVQLVRTAQLFVKEWTADHEKAYTHLFLNSWYRFEKGVKFSCMHTDTAMMECLEKICEIVDKHHSC